MQFNGSMKWEISGKHTNFVSQITLVSISISLKRPFGRLNPQCNKKKVVLWVEVQAN